MHAPETFFTNCLHYILILKTEITKNVSSNTEKDQVGFLIFCLVFKSCSITAHLNFHFDFWYGEIWIGRRVGVHIKDQPRFNNTEIKLLTLYQMWVDKILRINYPNVNFQDVCIATRLFNKFVVDRLFLFDTGKRWCNITNLWFIHTKKQLGNLNFTTVYC